jgi:hypothetical protein
VNTVNRQYPLPHKNNVVLDDLEGIRTAFTKIDADIVETKNKIDDTTYVVSDLKNRVVHTSVAVENSEIQNIAPNRYLITNENGFECVEGGGDKGGKTSQVSIKRSDDNFDTIWGNILEVSTRGMTIQQNAEFSRSNETHIFANKTDKTGEASRFPRADLVNQQITSDAFSENNESYILRDSIEQIIGSDIMLATRENFGFIKIGDGIISDNDGEISADGYGLASKTEFGLVKIGSNIEVHEGEINWFGEVFVASTTTFGVVKLGADFAINENGATEVVKNGDDEMVIYDLTKMKIVSNGIVDLEENIAIYRAFLNEDLVFSINIDFDPASDFSFWLEIISDGEHIVSFTNSVPEKISPLGVNRGITRIKFTKILGLQRLNAEVDVLEAPEPILLTPNYGDSVKSDLILSSNGSTWDPHSMMGTDVGNIAFQNRHC